MPKVKGKIVLKRDRVDLLVKLENQMAFIKSSASAFDSGNIREAARLATSVRVLLHDTNSSHSLLKQLGVKNQIKYHDTAFLDSPGNLLAYTGLCGLIAGDNT